MPDVPALPVEDSKDSKVVKELTLDHLLSGDREAQMMIGILASRALAEFPSVTFMVDALGRIRLMRQDSVIIKQKPTLDFDTLNKFDSDTAINLMVDQDSSEEEMINYLKYREATNADESL